MAALQSKVDHNAPNAEVTRSEPSRSPTSTQDLGALAANASSTFRTDLFQAMNRATAVAQSAKQDLSQETPIDVIFNELEKATPIVDRNRDQRISSNEIHSYLMKEMGEQLASSSLNTGTPEAPEYPYYIKSMLNHLENRSNYLLPVLKEQRIFNDALGTYKQLLQAFDTAFPRGFNRREALKALDGLDGSPRDGKISDPELLALAQTHPKELSAFFQHMEKAILKGFETTEGVCEYLMARPEMMEASQMTRSELEAGHALARNFRKMVTAHNERAFNKASKDMTAAVERLMASE